MTPAARALLAVAQTIGRVGTWLLDCADRRVCDFANRTAGEDER